MISLAQASFNIAYSPDTSKKTYNPDNANKNNQFSDPKIKAKQPLITYSVSVGCALGRRIAECNFGWGLIVRGSLLLFLSVSRNTLTAQPFED
jgi:hypothetical protein